MTIILTPLIYSSYLEQSDLLSGLTPQILSKRTRLCILNYINKKKQINVKNQLISAKYSSKSGKIPTSMN